MIRRALLVSALGAACSSAAPTSEVPLWVIGTTPIVTIGTTEADPGHELAGVTGALRVPGGFIVANSGSRELRRFDSTGRFVRASGQKGQGPGDFGGAMTPFPALGDSLHVFDAGNLRWTLHDATGRYARVLPGGDSALPKPVWLHKRLIIEDRAPGPIPAWALAVLDGLPESVPGAPVRRARFDAPGFLWVSDSGSTRSWVAYADSALPVGRVVIPEGFELMEAGADFVLGVERDAMDQELVRAYSLTRTGNPASPRREPLAPLVARHDSGERSMMADFRNLLVAQEMFYSNHASYTARADSLDFVPATGAEVVILHGDKRRWAALLYDRKTKLTCGISVGFPAPAGWVDGFPFCGR